MGKAKSKRPVAYPPSPYIQPEITDTKGKRKASEIDDIFAGGAYNGSKSKGSAPNLTDAAASMKKGETRKRKRRPGENSLSDATGREAAAEPNVSTAAPNGKALVTVVDTSSLPPSYASANAASKKRKRSKVNSDQRAKDAEADEAFKDSRGTSIREYTLCDYELYALLTLRCLGPMAIQGARRQMVLMFTTLPSLTSGRAETHRSARLIANAVSREPVAILPMHSYAERKPSKHSDSSTKS